MPPTFAQLGVPDSICRALERRGITESFEIQAATVADAMAGRDVSGRAPTGSGKTLAFGIPLVATVDKGTPRRPRALILSPTRELADQIATELRTLSTDVRFGVVYGGVGYGPQVKALRRGVDILVACPGRLEDLIEQREVDLRDVDRVVIDEADRMADMGFLPAVRRLLDATASKRQTVLFSATLDGDVAKLVRDYQHNPVRHEVGDATPDITAADHHFWKVTRDDRLAVCAATIESNWPAIVFCRTRHGSDRVAKNLKRFGIDAVAIHGGRSQSQRTRALDSFMNGRTQALIATDVAARGIHVDGVEAVIHFDPPEDHKTYIHRSGRTARAGEGGKVFSLVQPEQGKAYRDIQRRLKLEGDHTAPEKMEPSQRPRPVKSADDRNDSGGSNRNGEGRPRNRSGAKKGNGRRRHSSDRRGAKAGSRSGSSGKGGGSRGGSGSNRSRSDRAASGSGSGGGGQRRGSNRSG